VQTGSPKTTSAPVSLASLAGMTDPKKGTPANNASVAAGEGDENQRRQNARERMRERMDTFFDEEYEKAADPEVQQRLEQMEQYIEQMGELRRAMRNASPDKRAELREQMGETVAALRDIGEAQQDYMLRDLARQYNISDPHDQDAFVSSFRELQSSPFFRPENLVWGNARRAFRNAAQK